MKNFHDKIKEYLEDFEKNIDPTEMSKRHLDLLHLMIYDLEEFTYDDLKCCANCIHYILGKCEHTWEEKRHDDLCENWEWNEVKEEDKWI